MAIRFLSAPHFVMDVLPCGGLKRNLSDANFLDVIFQMSLQEGVDL